jgi:hypothetical protein
MVKRVGGGVERGAEQLIERKARRSCVLLERAAHKHDVSVLLSRRKNFTSQARLANAWLASKEHNASALTFRDRAEGGQHMVELGLASNQWLIAIAGSDHLRVRMSVPQALGNTQGSSNGGGRC